MTKSKKQLLCIIISFVVMCVGVTTLFSDARNNNDDDDENHDNNKFNVVVLLDASNSLKWSDENDYRYEAIGLFINLLTEEGNSIGNVIFSTHVDSKQNMISADGQKVKNDFLEQLQRDGQPRGYTNIGEGLNEAVDILISGGNKNLPSIILFLSDGNSEMETDDELDKSLELKADALQRARENDIRIFSVCLNANDMADTEEMKQLSDATGGEFREVANAEDLLAVFDTFYNLVFGTSSIKLPDPEPVPENGIIKENFTLPSFGVEEVNLIIYGEINDISVSNPTGNVVNSSIIESSTYTIVKFSDIVGGEWTLNGHGEPGTRFRVSMKYNTNLKVNIESTAPKNSNKVTDEDEVIINGILQSGDEIASEDYQYSGYEAEIITMDQYRNVIDKNPMVIKNGKFEYAQSYTEGVYYYQIEVKGNYLSKTSEEYGPVKISHKVEEITTEQSDTTNTTEITTEEIVINSIPKPVKNPVKKKVYIIPFKKNSVKISFNKLAKDDEDGYDLKYDVISSSFKDKDYVVNDKGIKVTSYSLKKGAFTIRAYDSMGEYCDIEVIITSINVGLLAILIVAFIALVILIVSGIILYKRGLVSFKGTVVVRSNNNGSVSNDTISNKRGYYKLKRLHIDTVGLKGGSGFQATGKEFIIFNAKPCVYFGGRRIKKIRIDGNGSDYTFYTDKDKIDRSISVSFIPTKYGRKQDSFGSDSYDYGFSNDDYGKPYEAVTGGNIGSDYGNPTEGMFGMNTDGDVPYNGFQDDYSSLNGVDDIGSNQSYDGVNYDSYYGTESNDSYDGKPYDY